MLHQMITKGVVDLGNSYQYIKQRPHKRHTSKPGPDSDSDPKKTRTREKPGLVLGLAFEKPGLDNRKPGLQIVKYWIR